MSSTGQKTIRQHHLSCWRTILNDRHKYTNRPTEYEAFIHHWVKNLDEFGFSWNQLSVIDVLLEIGPPTSTQDAAKDLIRVPDSQPSPPINALVLNSDSPELEARQPGTNRASLMDLPVEITLKIVDRVEKIAAEEKDYIYEKRQSRLTHVMAYQTKPEKQSMACCLYTHNPILNSLQSLAVVNQAFHSICAPLLWNRVNFPTQLPARVELWTDEILPRHGHLVKCLKLTISEEALRVPQSISHRIDLHDNIEVSVSLEHISSRTLSPRNAIRILEATPGVDELTIQLPEGHGGRHERFMKGLDMCVNQLGNVMSRLSNLRKLDLRLWDDCHISPGERTIVPLISNLRCLQSFSCTGFGEPSGTQGTESLGYCLSQLQQLQYLKLEFVGSVNRSWLQHTWPGRIIDITLMYCEEVTHKDFHKLVHKLAPNVRRIKFMPCTYDPDTPIYPYVYNLPELTQFDMGGQPHDPLPGFSSSKLLQRISTHCYESATVDFTAALTLLTDNTWPLLRSITWEGSTYELRRCKKFKDYEKYCDQANIQLALEQLPGLR